MKRTVRTLVICLALTVLLPLIPFRASATVSIPDEMKSVVFNATYYANKYSDLKKAFGYDAEKLYSHYLYYGVREGRQASPMFNIAYFLSNSSDLNTAFKSDRELALEYFLSFGYLEPRRTAEPADLGTDVPVRISLASTALCLGISETNVISVMPELKGEQIWRLSRYDDGSYRITLADTESVLHVSAGANQSGTNVELHAGNETSAQRWYFYDNLDGTYTIRAKCGTTCSLTAESSSNGANVRMTTYAGLDTQVFHVTPVGLPETAEPVSYGDDFLACIRSVSGDYRLEASGTDVSFAQTNSGDSQIWHFVRSADNGCYRISNVLTGKALGCSSEIGVAGTTIQASDPDNGRDQCWYLFSSYGNYLFVPACTTDCAMAMDGTGAVLSTYTADSASQRFTIEKLSDRETEKRLAITEICATPANGAYEFLELMNTSTVSVKLSDYSLYRFSAANDSLSEELSYRKILGLEPRKVSGAYQDTSLSCLTRINLSDYSVDIAPGGLVVLWFVSYENQALTTDQFKEYWSASDATVVRIPIYDSTGTDIYAADQIQAEAGNGFLPDSRVASAYSLISNEVLSTPSDGGIVLGNLTAPLDYGTTAAFHNVADCIALQFVSDTVSEVGTSRNFYHYVDAANFAEASKEAIEPYYLTYLNVLVAPLYEAQLTGALGQDGCPVTDEDYLCYSSAEQISAVLIGVDCGTLEAAPTPGSRNCNQFSGLEFTSITRGDFGGILLTGSFRFGDYQKAGFRISGVNTQTGAVFTSSAFHPTFTDCTDHYSFSVALGGFPVGVDMIYNIVPVAVSAKASEIVNGPRIQINCPLKKATLNGASIDGLKVVTMMQEVGASVNDYTGFKEAGKLFAADLEYLTGADIQTGVYNPRVNYPQIVIASSGTSAPGNAFLPFGKTLDADESGIYLVNGDIFIIGGSAIAAEYASRTILAELKNATGVYELTTLCESTADTFNPDTDTLPLTDGTDYRIMTLNVERNELNPDTARLSNFIESIKYYSPDVIGFQEYCAWFTANLTPQLQSLGYTVIGNEVFDGAQNFTPLAYKTDKFTCGDSDKGLFVLSAGDVGTGYGGFTVTWAVLTDKTTNEQIAFTTTHFFHNSDRTIADPVRQINAQQIVEKTKELISLYKCEVINMGDYNSYTIDPAYTEFIGATTSSGSRLLYDARYEALRGYSGSRSSHADGTSDPRYSSDGSIDLARTSQVKSLDLFFSTSGIEEIRCRIAMNQTTAGASDHFAVYMDIIVP